MQLTGDVEDVLADHRLFVGPPAQESSIPGTVIAASRTERQATLLVRGADTPPAGWAAEPPDLEALVMATCVPHASGSVPRPSAGTARIGVGAGYLLSYVGSPGWRQPEWCTRAVGVLDTPGEPALVRRVRHSDSPCPTLEHLVCTIRRPRVDHSGPGVGTPIATHDKVTRWLVRDDSSPASASRIPRAPAGKS